MKKLLIALSAVTLFASCKKEDLVSPVPVKPAATKSLVKAVYVYDNGTPEINNYTYDAQGRVTIIKEDNRTYAFSYVSASSLVVTQTKNTDNSVAGTKECEINANGYITKIVFKDPAGAVTYTYEYTYNADGYITKQTGYMPGASDYEVEYTIVNGNVVSEKNYNSGGLSYTAQYTYDNNKINKTPVGHSGYWQLHNLFGKRSKNMLIECKSVNPAGAITWHTKNTYDMDADGYPVKESTSNLLNGKQSVSTYTYQ